MGRRLQTVKLDARLADRIGSLPVLVHEASRGFVVAITANLHGDELTGLFAAHRLDTLLGSELRNGTVAIYPSLNPPGLRSRTRTVGLEGADLNRSFPGDARGNLAERLAAAIWADVLARKPNLVIDLHADSAQAVPYVLIDRPVSLTGSTRAGMEEVLDAAGRATGLLAVRDYPDEEYRRFQLDRSLTGALVNHAGIPSITLEVGPRRIGEPAAIERVVKVLLGLLAEHGLTDGEKPRRSGPVRWRRTTAWKSTCEGLVVPLATPGATVEEGERIAEIHAIDGRLLDTIAAPESGVVLSWPDTAWTTTGAPVGTFGARE